MSNQKWEIGPVKLVNGWGGSILQFDQHRKVYLGIYNLPGGGAYVIEWRKDGTCIDHGLSYNLAPPPKKKVRVNVFLNVCPDGMSYSHQSREDANSCASEDRIALYELDVEVEEGHGL